MIMSTNESEGMILRAFKNIYCSRFLKRVNIRSNSGKMVCIRKEYHHRIQRILNASGNDKVTLSGYIDNVLTEHFATYQKAITVLDEEYQKQPIF